MAEQKKEKKKITYIERVLNVWAVVLIAWSLYRAYFGTSLPIWFDEFFAKPAIFIVPVYLFIKHYEKRSPMVLFGTGKRFDPADIAIGLAAGSVFFIIGALNGTLKFVPMTQALFIIAIALVSSITEELLSRGFILRRIYDSSKKFLISVIYASVLFFLMHVPILFTDPNMHGSILIRAMIVNMVLSVIVSTVYLLRRGNLTAPVLIHALYVMSVAFSR